MHDSGGVATTWDGMLITSAVAIFFSCSGATGFSELEFESESSVAFQELLSRPILDAFSCRFVASFYTPEIASRWTDEACEG
jgi:hypothetical protein